MSVLRHFVDGSRTVLQHILNVHVSDVHETAGSQCLPDESVAASLRFFGDCHGYISMIVREGDVRRIVGMVLGMYDIAIPVESGVVFSEVLNIYAGNLVTELTRKGIDICIDSPAPIDCADDAISEAITVTMMTDDHVPFKFCFYLRKLPND